MRQHFYILVFSLAAWASAPARAPAETPRRPNIVVILADDLGYGDVHCLNPNRGKIVTPNIDRLAAQGMTFTDAHSNSSVCSPSRYGLLTGRYSWRTYLQRGVAKNSSKPLIAKDRLTLPGMLKKRGYDTAAIGKWHLGWKWTTKSDGTFDPTQKIGEGPVTRGFDWYFGTPFNPGCFMENDHLIGAESLVPAEKGKFKYARTAVPDWRDEKMLPTFTDKACEYIRREAQSKRPFFVYYAMTAPHLPLAPTKQWKGKSGLGSYADFVMEVDAMVGRVVAAVDEAGASRNTILVFTSDNGCAPYVGTAVVTPATSNQGRGAVKTLEAKGHFPSARFRGYKSDAWDGGHRIPLLVRWPGVVAAKSTSGQLVCLNDLLATFADITGFALPENAGEDSVSFLPLLKGNDRPMRNMLVHHSFQGHFAIRRGLWKLVLCPGSGGWSPPPRVAKGERLPPMQLYNMSLDEGERKNVQARHPEIVAELTRQLKKIIADGRSTPGTKQQNDVPVDVFKKAK